jgi:hypothetical protein
MIPLGEITTVTAGANCILHHDDDGYLTITKEFDPEKIKQVEPVRYSYDSNQRQLRR